MNDMQVAQHKRPKWAWAISIFYFLSAAYTLLSFYLINSGAVAAPEATKSYLDSLTATDYAFTILIGLANFIGAISLFLLRKMAYPLFLASFAASVPMSVWHIVSKNMLSAFVSGGAIGMLIGWGILLAVCLYLKKLTKLGVLR
jgi:hypothetical protein